MVKTSRLIVIALASLVLIAEGYCGYKVHQLSARQQRIKGDYSVVNNITFGLLSVSKWRDKVVAVIHRRLHHFNLTRSQEQELLKEIEQLLYSLIDKTAVMMDRPQKTVSGKLRKFAFHTLVKKEDLDKLVPVYSREILRQIEKPQSKARLSDLAQSKLRQLDQETYDSSREIERKTVDSIFSRYRVADTRGFDQVTVASLSSLERMTYLYAFGMLGCILLMLALWWVLRKHTGIFRVLYILSILSALILLLVGLTTTMIEVDARIKLLDFRLMGETISFSNQVLFFQSKSILDVVVILLQTHKYDAVLVGALILCFSIIFPVAKLLSAGIYLLGNQKRTKNKVLEFFAFKSGKWSMADVMVVAILMTYIGFNGIIESQLSGLNIHNEMLTSITTNQTALQPGYIVFTGFVLYGLVLSQILKSILHHDSA